MLFEIKKEDTKIKKLIVWHRIHHLSVDIIKKKMVEEA